MHNKWKVSLSSSSSSESEPVISSTISVFGLGYVGCVTSACLAEGGMRVIGVDLHKSKIALINRGRATIVEPGLDELLADGHRRGLISATCEVAAAVRASSVSIITVGTPSS